ncbi:unnamed protein product, partial [Cyprideis torosa]
VISVDSSRLKRSPQSKLDDLVNQVLQGVDPTKYKEEKLPDDPNNPYTEVQEERRKDTSDQVVPVDNAVEERTGYEPPQPLALGVCGIEYECVETWQCDANGDILTTGSGIIDLRQQGPKASQDYFGGFSEYPANTKCELYENDGYSGVCCRKPRIEACPNAELCMAGWRCPHLPPWHRYQSLQEHPRGCVYPNEEYSVCCPPKQLYPPVPLTCGVRNPDGIKPTTPVELYPVLDKRVLEYNIRDEEAKFGEFPWQALFFVKKTAGYEFLCGGVLISTRHLLTAAHYVKNVDPYHLQVRLGEWEVNNKDEPIEHQDYFVEYIHVHPEYKPGPEFNDIAIVTLTKQVYITNNVHVACLPQNQYENFDSYRCIATGWGKNSFDGSFQTIMKKVDLPMYTHDDCQAALRRTRLGHRFRLHENFVCAGGEKGKDACTGDGGGPLICEKEGHAIVAGITAWGIGCGTEGVPGVYAALAPHVPWIQGIMAAEDGNTYPRVLGFDPHVTNPYTTGKSIPAVEGGLFQAPGGKSGPETPPVPDTQTAPVETGVTGDPIPDKVLTEEQLAALVKNVEEGAIDSEALAALLGPPPA